MGTLGLLVIGGIILFFLIISLVFGVIRSLVPIALGILTVYFLFLVIFIWSPTEILQNLKTDIWLTEEGQKKAEQVAALIEDGRKHNKYIDAEQIDEHIRDKAKETASKESIASLRERWVALFDSLQDDEKRAIIEEHYESLRTVFSDTELNQMKENSK